MSHFPPSVRLWMGSLARVKARLTASSAPRKVWDQTKRGPRRICRYASNFESFPFGWKFTFLCHSPTAEQKEKVKPETGKTHCLGIFKMRRDWHRFSAKEGASRREQARPRTNIQVTFDSRKALLPAFDAFRGWMASLGMARVRHMASTAPRRGSDQVKRGLRQTFRW